MRSRRSGSPANSSSRICKTTACACRCRAISLSPAPMKSGCRQPASSCRWVCSAEVTFFANTLQRYHMQAQFETREEYKTCRGDIDR